MREILGPLAAFTSSITWALGSVAYSRLSARYNAQAVNISRALVALPLLVGASIWAAGGPAAAWGHYGRIELRHWGWLSLSMVASYALGDVLFMGSTVLIGVPAALAIASTYPVWTALVGWLLRGEALAAGQILGLVLALGGVVAVILLGREGAPEPVGRRLRKGHGLAKGVALAMGTSLFWALNSYAVAHVGNEIDALLSNTVRMVLALGMVPLVGLGLGVRGPWILPAADFRRFLWVIALESFVGSLSFVYGLAHTSLAVGSTLSSLAPVLAVPVAWVMGTEKVSWGRTLGVLAVVLGLAFLVRT